MVCFFPCGLFLLLLFLLPLISSESSHSNVDSSNQESSSVYHARVGVFPIDPEPNHRSPFCEEYNCQDCIINEDCPHNFVCHVDETSNKYCTRRPLFTKFSWNDGLASGLAFLAAAFAAGGGMGGGGLFVPIFILCAMFVLDEAIPLSQATIFGGAFVSFVINLFTPHPKDRKRPIIDFLAILLVQPPMILGTVSGVFFQVMSPHWMILLVLTVLLIYTSVVSSISAYRMYNKENEERRLEIVAKNSGSEYIDSSVSLLSNNQDDSPKNYSRDESINKEDKEELEYQKVIQSERSLWKNFFILLAFLIIVTMVTLFRGGNPTTPSIVGVTVCSTAFWVISGLMVPIFLSVMVYPIIVIRRNFAIKQKLEVHNLPGEVQWTVSNLILYPIYFYFIGFVGGYVGIGGGMFSSPVLLAIGMLPEVAVATSSTTVLISSFAATLNFYVLDELLLDYAAWYSAIGILGTLLGLFGIRWLCKKYNRTSIIAFTIALVITIAAVLMLVVGIMKLKNDIESKMNLTFTRFCKTMIRPPSAA